MSLWNNAIKNKNRKKTNAEHFTFSRRVVLITCPTAFRLWLFLCYEVSSLDLYSHRTILAVHSSWPLLYNNLGFLPAMLIRDMFPSFPFIDSDFCSAGHDRLAFLICRRGILDANEKFRPVWLFPCSFPCFFLWWRSKFRFVSYKFPDLVVYPPSSVWWGRCLQCGVTSFVNNRVLTRWSRPSAVVLQVWMDSLIQGKWGISL